MTDTTKTPDEMIAEILGRHSVTDLTEQTDADLERADDLFYKSDKPMEVIAQGEYETRIRWWKIRSGSEVYEVRRFKNFVWCQCKAFFFSRKACKHIAQSCGALCIGCGVMRAKIDKLCHGCHSTQRQFLKPPSTAISAGTNQKTGGEL